MGRGEEVRRGEEVEGGRVRGVDVGMGVVVIWIALVEVMVMSLEDVESMTGSVQVRDIGTVLFSESSAHLSSSSLCIKSGGHGPIPVDNIRSDSVSSLKRSLGMNSSSPRRLQVYWPAYLSDKFTILS